MTLELEPLSPAIGALVRGVDLVAPLDVPTREALGAALVRHCVLFFENQPLSPVQQRSFASQFGELHIHPIYRQVEGVPELIVLDTDANNVPDNDTWHTDVTFIQSPPLGAILSARHLPPSGGDTLWSSSVAAYDGLSESFRRFLDPLTAEHDMVKSFPAQRYARTPEERTAWEGARAKNPPVVHPVVRRHPVSGRHGLFVNEGFTTRILELGAKESDAVLRVLFEHVAKPEFTVRWRWKLHDLAFWDNRSTQHYAASDYLPHRRVMHRATILGDRPFH